MFKYECIPVVTTIPRRVVDPDVVSALAVVAPPSAAGVVAAASEKNTL